MFVTVKAKKYVVTVNHHFRFQSTSCQGVVELAVGQQVYVKLIKGGFHASKFHPSSFSGFQLD